MKKFTLFLVAMFAMVNIANAQRAWAYDLGLTSESESYTFTFKAVTAANATLVFYQDGVEAGTLNLGSVAAGQNTVTKTSAELLSAIQKSGDFTWGVKMTGGAIAAAATLSLIKSHIYYNMMGVVTDLDTESKNFGRVYLQMSFDGKPTHGSTKQTAGFFEFDPLMNLLSDDANNGVKPLLPQGYTLDGSNRDQFHRLHINPKTGDLVFSHNIENKPGVFAVNPDNLSGNAKNLLDGITGLTGMGGTLYRTSAHCFDNDGALFVMDIYPYKDSGYANGKKNYGYLYKIVDGQAVVIDEGTEWANASIAMASDGRGGLWIAQNRSQIDGFYQLAHIKDGVDFAVYEESNHGFSGAAERGAVAYDQVHNILAWGRERKVMLFDVSYDETTGIPMLTKIAETEALGRNIDCLAFDYAGDLYVGSSSSEIFYKYAVPTTNNTCTTPAKKSQVITLVSATPEHTVTINVNGNGTVTGANTGKYLEGTELTLTPKPNTGYEFTGWTFEDETTSTDNPLIITVDGDKNITANFAKKQYTLTVQANDPTKGSVALDPAGSTYEYETEVTLTATANDGCEFVSWSNGSKENPLTITMEENTELTANFRAILPTSITLYAHPTKDYSTSIVGKLKRAIQNGENTIVLTHEDNGTPHIYNIAHATKEVTEISQVGVVAVDPDNAGDFLAISDIALTDDGKLVACNYMMCQITANEVDAGYKRGTSRFYIWDNLGGDPRLWISSQLTGNYYRASMGYTMALKGTSMNAEVTISAFNKTNANTRYSHLYVVDGAYSDANYKYSRENASLYPSTLGPNTYELNASPLAAGKWIVDGELASPIEFVEKNAVAIDTYTALNTNVLGKKYNGASYLFHNDHHLMVAPYADGDGKLAGVKVLGITDGFANPAIVETNATLANAIDATTAAATAYVDTDGDLTIYLIADGKVYTFSEKEFTAPQYTINAHADHTSKGYVIGGGDYYEGEEVVLKATAKSGYYFTQWNDGNTDNPRTITVDGDKEYIAEFAEAQPRAWAYDMKLGEDVDNYTFTFKATAAGQATITFKDKDGKALAQPASQTIAAVVGENKFTIAKNAFAAGVDAFWSIIMDGEPIPAIAEVTDQTRGIYDFYNMMGVVVDNNTDSKDFGKIYVQASLNGKSGGITDRAKAQKAGIFIYNQDLDELNDPSNTGYKPTVPSGYTEIGSSSSAFQRLNIHPKTGNLVYSHAIDGKPAVFAINREDMTGAVTNLLTGVADMTRSVAHCFDAEGMLYVMDFADEEGTVYKVINGEATPFTATSDKFINAYITIVSDGRGGLWISQNRGQFDAEPYPAFYQLAHVTSTGEFDWVVNRDTPHGLEGSSSRGALAYDVERKILAQGRNGKVELYTVSYEPTITLTPLYTIASDDLGNNIDGLAFDYAGDLYVVNSSKEKFQKFTLPTADNICTVAAPALEAVRFTPVYTVSVASNNNEWGIANGGGTFEKDQNATITAVAATNYKFVNWTKDDVEVSTENPYTFAVTESATYVANFVEKTTYTINVTYDNTMGIVTGVGSYYEGTEVTLTATANTGYRFVNWTYGSETSTNNSLELVVEGNITVIANFEPVQYTLIAPTNDENKGTVSVDGVCTHGSTVTLTATAKPGYKLLYWSDRSTENPRTITMTKNEAISAYFVKEYAEEPTFKIEKVWENTNVPASTANGYQAVGWDGKIYMQNKTAGKIITYSSAEDTGTEYATSGLGQQIAVDEAGNLIVFNATFSTANPNAILIYQKGSTEGKAVSFTLKDPAACHFFSASGDIYSAEGGYVYFYCNGKTAINRLKITNGAATASDVTTDLVGESVYSSPQNTNYVMVDIFGNLVAHARSNKVNVINVHTNESKAFTLPNIKMGTLGGCSFELGGKELWAYHAGASNYSSEWNIYNMTDSKFLSDDDFYAVDKSATTNYACNWLNVQVVDENTAYIYQFCPLKAMAIWKVTLERDDLQEFTVTATANDPAMGTVTGEGTYYKDATATLTATPQVGYRFVNWTKAGVEVSTNATYTFTVTEDVELVANFEALPEITYELNGGVWNQYDWTSKKDMYDAFVAEWTTYSSSGQSFCSYETQLGIGNSNQGLPTAILSTQPILEFMAQTKWAWLGQFLDALATAQGKATKPTEAVLQMRYALGNFFGEDNNGASNWIGAVDCSGDKASLSAFAHYWGQTFPMPTQPTEEVVLNTPYKEGCEFGGWFVASDFSGVAVTTVDENTDGTLYAKWIETIITVTIGEDVDNTTNLAPYVDKTVTATVTRHFGANKILTVTLPFDMNASQISTHFGNATVYEFYNVVDAGEELHLQFSRTTSIEAGKPYIIQTAASGYDAEDGFTIEGVTVTTELTPIELSGITMVPVLDGGGRLENANEYFLSNSALYCAGDYPRDLQGLRAYFTSNSSKTLRARVVFDDNEETSLPTITNPNNNVQKIVKNGQLIIIRGENQYNAQGQTISIE